MLLAKPRLKKKLAKLEEEAKRLKAIEKGVRASPDQQILPTDRDCRLMATSGGGCGMVAYNLQRAVDTEHHLIVAHELTNVGARTTRSWQRWRRWRRPRCTWTNSKRSPIAVTSRARKFWHASRLA